MNSIPAFADTYANKIFTRTWRYRILIPLGIPLVMVLLTMASSGLNLLRFVPFFCPLATCASMVISSSLTSPGSLHIISTLMVVAFAEWFFYGWVLDTLCYLDRFTADPKKNQRTREMSMNGVASEERKYAVQKIPA